MMHSKIYGNPIATPINPKKLAPGGGGVTSWNDLTDKPFGDEKVYYEWNRNTEYTEKAPLYDGAEVAGYIVKLSNDTPVADFFIGKYARMVWEGQEGDPIQITKDAFVIGEDMYTLCEIFIVVTKTMEITINEMRGTLTEGVWVPDLSDSPIESVKILDPATPIPEAVIPDTIARVSQIPKIPEVPVQSVNGQTGEVEIDVGVTKLNGETGELWADPCIKTWDDLWDKPFGSGNSIYFDGFEDGKEYLTIDFELDGNVVNMVWVSPFAPTIEEVIGGKIKRLDHTEVFWTWIAEDMIKPIVATGTDYRIDYSPFLIYVIREPKYSPRFVRPGVYFSQIGSGNESMCVRGLVLEYEKKLDEKYIPDTIARVKDIPEGGGGLSRDEVQTMIDTTLGVIENGTY